MSEAPAASEKPRRRARLRDRFANASVKTAFLLYAAGGILAALVLSFAVTGALGLVADSTLVEDPYAYTGTYLYDAEERALVPAEALSWYEIPAADAAYGASASDGGVEESEEGSGDAGAADHSKVVVLYVESQAHADSEDIPVDDPPAGARDGTVVDIAVTYGTVSAVYDGEGANLSFADIPAYDAAAKSGRASGSGVEEAAESIASAMPANADGEQPLVSTVAYYLPYTGDPALYRALAGAAIASVPVVFVVCLVVAGRRFYRARIAGPVAAMDSAARRIAAGDLDFEMIPQRGDELGRLCTRFEEMRAELARSKAETWRAAESRRRVNAAFAHDLRTPLTVIRGRAEIIGMVSDDDRVVSAASAISRQAGRLAAYADSMSGLDSLEDAPVVRASVACEDLLRQVEEDVRSAAEECGVAASVLSRGLPSVVEADAAAILRVADNLASNAARHAASAVEVALSWEDGVLVLKVADDGPGFGDAAARALEPFWRGEGDRAASAGGSDGHMGLGLYVCSVLCARHGGSLAVGDKEDGGAVATATFAAE